MGVSTGHMKLVNVLGFQSLDGYIISCCTHGTLPRAELKGRSRLQLWVVQQALRIRRVGMVVQRGPLG